MKLWLVCFFILFAGAETAQWLGQLPWLGTAELSMPLTVLGGIGLAIASNGTAILGRPRISSPANQPTGAAPETPLPSDAIATLPRPPKTTPRGSTISFEIKKPQRQG